MASELSNFSKMFGYPIDMCPFELGYKIDKAIEYGLLDIKCIDKKFIIPENFSCRDTYLKYKSTHNIGD